jgi:hypothetical protein
MVARHQVLQLVEAGMTYEQAAAKLHIDAGLAYMIATGLPADGSDSLTSGDRDRLGFLAVSTQPLANPEKADRPTGRPSVREWIKQRAHADAQMLAAAAARDARPGKVEGEAESFDVVDVIGRDHNQVNALVQQLSTIPGHKKGGSAAQLRRRQSVVDLISVALSRHEATEQEYLWPAVREALPDGGQRAAEALDQEQRGKDTLAALARVDPDSDEFDELVERLVLRLRKHVAFEDRVLLDLRGAMDGERRAELGRRLRRAERMAPGRPHPHAPKEPAAAVQPAGAPAAALDKVRDTVGHRPARRKGKAGGEAEAKRRQAQEAAAAGAAAAEAAADRATETPTRDPDESAREE